MIAIGRPYSQAEPGKDDLVAEILSCQAGEECSSDASWSLSSSEAVHAPSNLSKEQRAQAAAHWSHSGSMEHASVASFSRFSLDLMAMGAPADLVQGAHLAALDEIKHTQLSFSLASLFNGTTHFTPDKFIIPDAKVEIARDLSAMVARTLAEGCIGETLAAVRAFYGASSLENLDHQARQAEEPFASAVLSALSAIAVDEARHAALAWDTVKWAFSQEDGATRSAIISAIKKLAAQAHADDLEPAAHHASMPLSDATVDFLHSQAIQDLVLPALKSIVDKQKFEPRKSAHPAVFAASTAIFL